MNQFSYKKRNRLKALSAKITDFSYKKHAHAEYALGVTRKGIQHYHLEGSLQLSHENGIMFFNPEQIHDGSAHDEQGLDYIMLYLEPSLLLEAMERKEYIQFNKPVIYNRIIQQHVLNLSDAVFEEADELVCDDLLFKLANALSFNSTKLVKRDSLIEKMKQDIKQNVKHFYIEALSNKYGMNKFQFIRFFNLHAGITPYQYYLNHKVNCARRFMEQERDPYLAVMEFDFADLTHLNRQFKRIYGSTATNYIKQLV
ncbi:AraC family transcriptional regulator [Shouchella lehensis]|uniref:AraC family transcriptional regulator n=1 Tax=Shouchella lehensis TaxID=300825 RepID=A0A4Y7WKJ4_9BACI|nr:AraC family transcriptional regulator [Shouchella lehensis]MBG9783439.1 AraC family transcriptional regulator [Shouchella lehensis]RQW22345.1 AraC family transcriptional regulator [Bacillus sp. C1-1]TES49169.1 AraC family transcriptional regulator [Shouchella lehensis]